MKLKINDLSCYEQKEGWLFDGFCLEVSAGDFVEVEGLSYAAGTALADCIAGRRKPESGNVSIDKDDDKKERKVRVSIVDRETGLLPYLTLRENLLLVSEVAKKELTEKAAAEELRIVQDQLDLFQCEYKLSDQLSVKEMDRARLAMAILIAPDILVINGLPENGTKQDRVGFTELAKSVCKAANRIVVMIGR
jgi:ABC-type multidrug transport system, ATPase component